MRVALCGYGNMGRHHGQMLKKHGADVELCAIADAREERRQMIAEDFPGMKIYQTGQESITQPEAPILQIRLPRYTRSGFLSTM